MNMTSKASDDIWTMKVNYPHRSSMSPACVDMTFLSFLLRSRISMCRVKHTRWCRFSPSIQVGTLAEADERILHSIRLWYFFSKICQSNQQWQLICLFIERCWHGNVDVEERRFTCGFASSLLVRVASRLTPPFSGVFIADDDSCWKGVILNENFWRRSAIMAVGKGPKL